MSIEIKQVHKLSQQLVMTPQLQQAIKLLQLTRMELVDLVRDHSHTCYQGNRTKKNAWGYGCGTCPACELRAKGYRAYAKAK